jgi:hypothetical protein
MNSFAHNKIMVSETSASRLGPPGLVPAPSNPALPTLRNTCPLDAVPTRRNWYRICMTWYKVTLSPADISAGKPDELVDEFRLLFGSLGNPHGAGLFDGNGMHMYEYYFSPGAARIAMSIINRYRGVECAAPLRSSVGESVVNSGDREILFAVER